MNPPLPEPAATWNDPEYGDVPVGYTEAQLLAYRAEVIEMCAKVCIDLHANDQTNILYASKFIKELK